MTTVDLKLFVGPGKFAEDPDAIPVRKMLDHALGGTSGEAVFKMFRKKHPDLAFKKATGKRGQPEFCITLADLDLLQALADDDLAVREQETKIKGWKREAWHRAREPIVDFIHKGIHIQLGTPGEVKDLLIQFIDINTNLNEGVAAEIDLEKIQDAIKMEDPERQMFLDEISAVKAEVTRLQMELATANRRIGQLQRQRDARIRADAQRAIAGEVETIVQEIATTVAPPRQRRRKVEQKPAKRGLFGWLLGRSA